jgi:hypothetical protein
VIPEPIWYQPPPEAPQERFTPPRPELKPGRPRPLTDRNESVLVILALERQLNRGQVLSTVKGTP